MIDWAAPRAMRAIDGTAATLRAITSEVRPVPRTAAMAKPNRIDGKESSTSIRRISGWSRRLK